MHLEGLGSRFQEIKPQYSDQADISLRVVLHLGSANSRTCYRHCFLVLPRAAPSVPLCDGLGRMGLVKPI